MLGDLLFPEDPFACDSIADAVIIVKFVRETLCAPPEHMRFSGMLMLCTG